ncbi:MAG: methylenetetrahydrofolate--tRNA-(uracil(54)-C(5))-methyltransferase (FADH(2)-oxidizing) TrmFO [Christensenellales bacterium]|jgi:methylenetetrahydrofolate--tRNA-(uracil-5-)-methyltransferase
MSKKVNVIGAGLAGCEAAWQLAKRNIPVRLIDMKPQERSPAHKSDHFAELVCSNSLKADRVESSSGLLKEELRLLDSLIITCAHRNRVPAGGALAVSREAFSSDVTAHIHGVATIETVCATVAHIPSDEPAILATGPLTGDALAQDITRLLGEKQLYFYDASAPLVAADSLDYDKVYRMSRYNKGDADYINCPLNEDEYRAFYEALLTAETVPLRAHEDFKLFEGCMPIEALAKRGYLSMAFGMMKPIGLNDPNTQTRPFAVVQLRQDNASGSVYNLVGFQTNLRFGEQQRVFSMIPGLEHAEFLRYGVMHRNTFINSPNHLNEYGQLRTHPNLFFAGQITGVEGYVESAASGLVAGIAMAAHLRGDTPPVFSSRTATGALMRHIAAYNGADFQPMNINFGIIDPLHERVRSKQQRYRLIAQRALDEIRQIAEQMH